MKAPLTFNSLFKMKWRVFASLYYVWFVSLRGFVSDGIRFSLNIDVGQFASRFQVATLVRVYTVAFPHTIRHYF